MTNVEALFRPFKLKNLTLKNRIAMAPMTRAMSPGGAPGKENAVYYRRRVEGGTALIITEATTIDHPVASGDANYPNIHDPKALEGWRMVCDAVHEAGGHIMIQLWHMGMMRKPGTGPNPALKSVGPSGLLVPGKRVGETLSKTEVEGVIDAYARGAAAAMACGFDGVEVHGAHGYLIDQFLWDGTNDRDDRWGGDMLGRATFAIDVLKAVRRAMGEKAPLLLRLSQWKQQDFDVKLAYTPEDLSRLLNALAQAGVDCFHCSTRRFWEPEFEGSSLNFAGWAKRLTGKPTMTVGSIGLSDEFVASYAKDTVIEVESGHIAELVRRLEAEEFDLVAVGRALLSNADWANIVREGRYDRFKPYSKEVLASLA